jgi:hypothetical protein
LGLDGIGLVDEVPDGLQQSATEFGERGTSAAAHEQRCSDESLQTTQRAGEGRLIGMEVLGRPVETATLGHGEEHPPLGEVEGHVFGT